MIILPPYEAVNQSGEEFATAFCWRTYPVLRRIAATVADGSCGELCSLRFTWNRPAAKATSEKDFLFGTFCAMLDGAEILAGVPCSRLMLEKCPEKNVLFALAEFPNEITAEFELNECLPQTMQDICFLKANFTNGHIGNQPLVGHFNEEGMIFADEAGVHHWLVEAMDTPPAEGPIEQLFLNFRLAVQAGNVPRGSQSAPRLVKLIESSLL